MSEEKNEKKEKNEKNEENIVKIPKKDLENADKVRDTITSRLDALERAARLKGDEVRLARINALREEVKAAPKEAFRDKGFLSKCWTFLCNLARWAWACCTGSLRWVLEVALSAVRFLEDVLSELGACFTPFELAA